MKKSTRNWSDAPPEIIGLIAERLHSIEDFASFHCVCTSWRLGALNHPQSNISSKTLPWIMFPRHSNGEDEDESANDMHTFFSLSTDKFHKLNLPKVTARTVHGSQHGWLLLSHQPYMEIFNPLSRVCIPLPLFSTLKGYIDRSDEYLYSKIALAASPSSSSITPVEDRFIVFMIFAGKGKVAFTRPGDEAWTAVDSSRKHFDDIIYLENQVYIVDTDGLVTQFDISCSRPVGVEFALPPDDIEVEPEDGDERKFYLVEIQGNLYMVVKFMYRNHEFEEDSDDEYYLLENHWLYSFSVFKLDFGTRKWEEVVTIGDYALFIGRSNSFSIQVSEYPELRSCIAFTDHENGMKRPNGDLGGYNIENNKLAAFDFAQVSYYLAGPPFWFIPNLC